MSKLSQVEYTNEQVYQAFQSLLEHGSYDEILDFVSEYDRDEFSDNTLSSLMWTELREFTRASEELWLQREADYKQMVYGN